MNMRRSRSLGGAGRILRATVAASAAIGVYNATAANALLAEAEDSPWLTHTPCVEEVEKPMEARVTTALSAIRDAQQPASAKPARNILCMLDDIEANTRAFTQREFDQVDFSSLNDDDDAPPVGNRARPRRVERFDVMDENAMIEAIADGRVRALWH